MKYRNSLRKLDARIASYEKTIRELKSEEEKKGYRKPGSQNRHKN